MKLKKSLVRWLSLALLIVAVVGVTVVSATEPTPKAPEGLVLEDMVIVVPANPTDVEKSAASELRIYLQKITGTSPVLRTEGSTITSGIYVGATKFAEENGVTFENGAFTDNSGLGEGWVIKAVGDSLVINGGAKRGVLYGVYHLLEDELGVRWWTHWESDVPTMEDAVLPYNFAKKGEPLFGYREVYIGAESMISLFGVRNRLNGWSTQTPMAYGGDEEFGRPYHVHTLGRYFPPFYVEPTSEKSAKFIDTMNPDKISYFEDHPEWYSWSESMQKRISSGQMCMTNQEFLEAWIEKILLSIELSYYEADLAHTPRPRYFDISCNDTKGQCECENCLADVKKYGDSGYLLKAFNQIADAVYEKYPEVILETLGYTNYLEPPKGGIKPAKNILIRLADSEMDVLQSLDREVELEDGTTHMNHNNDEVLARMKGWDAVCEDGQLMYWDYGLCYNVNGVFPSQFRYQNLLQNLYENSGWGYFMEMEGANYVEFWDMKLWMLAKLMEDPYQNEEKLMREFLDGYYGEAAGDALYDYLVFMHQKAVLHETRMTFLETVIRAEWLGANDILKAHNFFELAVSNTENDSSLTEAERELFINRINAARIGLDRVILENFTKYVNEIVEDDDPHNSFNIDRQETGTRMVNAAEWLISMEPEVDHTGVAKVHNRNKLDSRGLGYMDQYSLYSVPTDPNTGEKQEAPPVPQQIYDDHPGIDDKHIYSYTADSISMYEDWYTYMTYERNAASFPGGTAAKLDYGEAVINTAQKGITNRLEWFKVTEVKKLNSTLPGLFLNDPIIADGEYHLYRLKDIVAITESKLKIEFFGWTGMSLDLKKLEHLAGKKVDVYLSMKITGDPTGTDPRFYPCYYIDRIIIVEPCTTYDMPMEPGDEASCASNATMVGTCPACGQKAIREIEGTKLLHTIPDGYTYNEQTGKYEGYCTVCDETITADLKAKLPDDVFEEMMADGVDMSRILDFDLHEFTVVSSDSKWPAVVEDSKSLVGKAVMFNLDLMPEDMINYYRISDGDYWEINTSLAPKHYAADMVVNNEYHYYKFEDVALLTKPSDYLHFFSYNLQLKFADYPYLIGQKLDVYISLRIDGELDFSDPSKYPDYYIDRVLIVPPCPNHVPSGEIVFDEASQSYKAVCRSCGKNIELSTIVTGLPEELVQELAATEVGLTHSLMHVYDYEAKEFQLASQTALVKDDQSVFGETVRIESTQVPMDIKTYPGGLIGRITAEQIEPNINKGYALYKLENVPLINEGFEYVHLWYYQLQNKFPMQRELMHLAGKTVDLYISMRTEDAVEGPHYVNRMIVVDHCSDYMDAENLTVYAEPTCTTGTIMRGECPKCGRISTKEIEGTELGHIVTENYTFNSETNRYEAECAREGCDEVAVLDNIRGELPDVVMEALASSVGGLNSGLQHVYDYGTESFSINTTSASYSLVTDSTSALGSAVRVGHVSPPLDFYLHSSTAAELIHKFERAELKTLAGQGYQTHKFEDVKVPETGFTYLRILTHNIRNTQLAKDLAHLAGKTVDLYVSFRNDGTSQYGNIHGAYYFDRIIAVDTCEDHITEDDYVSTGEYLCSGSVNMVCPVCNQEYSDPEGSARHSFTDYVCDGINGGDEYIAYCDYGCGASETKYDKADKLPLDELLPLEDLPAGILDHIVEVYTARNFLMTGDQRFVWDHELGRGVAERDYVRERKTNYLNMASATSIGLGMSSTTGSHSLGSISGTDLVDNADKGYVVYALKGTVPIQRPVYNYFFMFGDWNLQIRGLDDDLVTHYRDKQLDFYVVMKVTGDPNCKQMDNLPTYYIDQIIVAESCKTDDTWVINREPTCTEVGEMTGDCSICGQKDVVLGIPVLEHTVINGILDSKATCHQDEVVLGYCAVCGQGQVKVPVPGTRLEHKFTNYKEDMFGKEFAFCDYGCGARHVKGEDEELENDSLLPELPDKVEDAIIDSLILGGAGGGGSFGFSFRDVKETDWFYDEVREAWENDLIDGVTADEYRPNETLTVAQAVKLAAALHEMYYTGSVTLTNGSGNWYDTYVAYAVNNGIIGQEFTGYSASKMNSAINRSEFVEIFAKALDENAFYACNQVADNAIPDVKMTDKNAEAIYTFYRAGILTGSDGAGTFNPGSSIKRSEVAAILIRMYDTNVRQAITLG